MSDIDLESEVLRFIGGARLYVWAVWRVLNLRRYQATMKWKTDEGEDSFKGEVNFINTFNIPYPHRGMNAIKTAKSDNGYNYVMIQDSTSGSFGIANFLLKFENGSLFRNAKEGSLEEYEPDFDAANFKFEKVTEWEISPTDEFIELANDPEQNIRYGLFSIDGEPYP